MLEKILARVCFKLKWKKLGLGILFGFFVVTISLCTVFRPHMDHPQSILEVPSHERFEPFPGPICNLSGEKSNYCELNGDIRIHGNSSSIYFNSPQLANIVLENNTWGIKLYPRKSDSYVMGINKQVWLKTNQEMPQCTVNHSLPAIVFPTGGYTGNIFHDISDVLIPLYLTSLHFNGEVQFIAQDQHSSWWIKRHEVIFKALSKYNIIDSDDDKEIRCFKNAIVGLKSHKDFGIDSDKFPYGLTLRNFTQFNRKIYSLERENAIKLSVRGAKKPRLLIISRKNTRLISNEDELVKEGKRLGYDVELIDASLSLRNFSKIGNSIDVMIGVHGAGLTNMIYLPENAVLIQVIPIALDIISWIFYERPAKDMNLKYLAYRVSENESSLIQQYPRTHEVITNPDKGKKLEWTEFKRIYMDNQDVRLDMSRFKIVLLKAMELLRS